MITAKRRSTRTFAINALAGSPFRVIMRSGCTPQPCPHMRRFQTLGLAIRGLYPRTIPAPQTGVQMQQSLKRLKLDGLDTPIAAPESQHRSASSRTSDAPVAAD